MGRKLQTIDYMAKCGSCGDIFTMVVVITPDPNIPNQYIGRVEKSRDLALVDNEILHDDGLPRHRCGGVLRVYGDDRRVRLVE